MPSFRNSSKKRRWAQGKKAFAMCDRTGFKHRIQDMVIEPGTGLYVYKGWNDGIWNIVDHPQNFPAAAGEAIGLENPRSNTIDPSPPFLETDDGSIFILDDQTGQPIFV
jgi:hypothetical protein